MKCPHQRERAALCVALLSAIAPIGRVLIGTIIHYPSLQYYGEKRRRWEDSRADVIPLDNSFLLTRWHGNIVARAALEIITVHMVTYFLRSGLS